MVRSFVIVCLHCPRAPLTCFVYGTDRSQAAGVSLGEHRRPGLDRRTGGAGRARRRVPGRGGAGLAGQCHQCPTRRGHSRPRADSLAGAPNSNQGGCGRGSAVGNRAGRVVRPVPSLGRFISVRCLGAARGGRVGDSPARLANRAENQGKSSACARRGGLWRLGRGSRHWPAGRPTSVAVDRLVAAARGGQSGGATCGGHTTVAR